MTEIDILFDLESDSLIWIGLTMVAMLPIWLLAACDPDRIRDAFSHLIPEFARGQLLLKNVAVSHLRYKNGHWTGYYQLTTSRPGDTVSHTTSLEGEIYPPGSLPSGEPQVQGDLGTEMWQAVVPDLNLSLKTKEAEKVLVSLPFLTDPDQSRQYLMRSIQSGSPQYHDLEILASHPNMVRYKPGSRCTIVYRLEFAENRPSNHHRPDRVVAKTYRGVKGKNAFDSMLALWNSALGSSSAVHIAEPLAYDEQERVMIQAAIPEEKTLKNLLNSVFQDQTPEMIEAAVTVLQKTAAGLAELHQSNVSLGEVWDWEDEMSEIRERVESLTTASPDLAQSIEPLLHRLNRLAAAYPADPVVPSHGSFRPSQVLIYQDQIGFIDFDGFCQSEPANDLAQFLATLMINSLTNYDSDDAQEGAEETQGAETLDARRRQARFDLAALLSEKFLDAYEQHHPVSRQRIAIWETLHILMLLLHYWIKVKPGALKEIIYLLERFLQLKTIVGEPS